MSTSLSASGAGYLPPILTRSEAAAASFTYRDLIDFHTKNLQAELTAAGKATTRVNNHRTAINMWLKHASWLSDSTVPRGELLSASVSDAVGQEMGESFDECLRVHLEQLAAEGLSLSTIKDRKSILPMFRESYFRLLEDNHLPRKFGDALRALLEKTGEAVEAVAKACGIRPNTMRRWLSGSTPLLKSYKHIAALEKHFGLRPGTLLAKVLPLRSPNNQASRSKKTPHRVYLSEMLEKPYALSLDLFDVGQKQEWEDLLRFYTDGAWVAAKGFKHSKRWWGVRPADGRNVTAEIKLGFVEDFFGHLSLPEMPDDPALRGVAFDPENNSYKGVRGLDPHLKGPGLKAERLSLALVSEIDLVYGHLEFRRGRVFRNRANNSLHNFLNFCAQLLRPETGFLWQQAGYGRKLSPKITSEKAWQDKCREAHARVNEILGNLRSNCREAGGKGKKGRRVEQSRDTSELVVVPLIRAREHPITVFLDMAAGLRDRFRAAEEPLGKAVIFRNLIAVELLSSNPMRAVNMAEMKYRPGCKGDEGDPTNLYKAAGGNYRLKYEAWELKNGADRGRYDLEVSPELTPDLDEYFKVWRPLLADANQCDFVFRQAVTPGSETFRKRREAAGKPAIQPLSANYFSRIVRNASIDFIPGCAGFGTHAARAFVATEYLKSHPGAYDVVAIILHDSEKVVRENYSWVSPDDIKPFWINHYSRVSRLHQRGES